MALKVRWTPEAENNFESKIKASGKEEIRKAVITKQTSMFYYIDEGANLISLLSFWDNRKNPEKLKY